MTIAGIVYLLRNEINAKLYIGITTRKLTTRLHEHWAARSQRPIDRAIAKYGRAAFSVTHLASADTLAELKALEIKLIAVHRSIERGIGYNLSTGGEGSAGVKKPAHLIAQLRARMTGSHHSAETKQLLSLWAKGRGVEHMVSGTLRAWADPERRTRLTELRRGRLWSSAQRARFVASRIGAKRGPYKTVAEKMALVCGPMHRKGENAYSWRGRVMCRACNLLAARRCRAALEDR